MRAHMSTFGIAPTSFFCEDCIAKDPQVLHDRITVDFSEAKEEETDCHYCHLSGMMRPAEVLFNGYPSCRECRKRKNVTNFVAKTADTNTKVIVTQIRDMNQSTAQPGYPKHTRSHITNMSMALPSNMGPVFSQQRKRNPLEHSMTIPPNSKFANPVMQSMDGLGKFEREGYSPTHQNRLVHELSDIGFSQMPNTVRHDRTMTTFDFGKMFKAPQENLQKPLSKMSEPKIIEFFKKINEQGISSLKNQLLYSSSIDGFSGKKFHQKCDQKSQIIVLITLDNGLRIGGFTYKSIDPKNIEVADNLSGLICTYDSKKIDFYPVNNAKILYQSNGITFGVPPNLSLNLEDLGTFICNMELGYYGPDGKKVCLSPSEKDWAKVIKEVVVYTFK